MVDAQRERNGDGDDPDGDNHEDAHVHFHAWLKRIDDDKVAIYCDGRRCQGRHVYADA